MKAKLNILMMCALCVMGCVRDPEVQYANSARGNVEALWQIIDEKYCFVEDKGLDWDEVLPVYQEKADSVKNQFELFTLLAQMLDTLHDGHVNLYSAFDVSRSSGWYDSYPSNYNSALMGQYIGNAYKIAGGLTYGHVTGHEEVGYVRYASFGDSFGSLNMHYVLNELKDCKGIILDVRNNGGGALTNAYKLASTFMKETTLVGYWQHKTGKGHQDFSPLESLYVDSADMPVKWMRPVVVLCNRRSYSATNMFVNCMKYAPKAIIVGGKTGGGGGLPLSYDLPIGWMVRFSSVRMTNREKISIEEGIEPDVEVTLTSEDKDDLMEKAIWIIEKGELGYYE